MDLGIIIVDKNSGEISLNHWARQMLGLYDNNGAPLPDGQVNEKLRSVGLDKSIEESQGKDSLATEIPYGGRAERFLRCDIFSFTGAGNNVAKVAVILRDVTHEKELEMMKTEFISHVSHEIRTPLSIARQGISLLLDGIPGRISDKQEKVLNVTRNNIDRLAHIIESLLDISKIETGKAGLKRTIANVAGLIRQVAVLYEARAREKGLQLVVNFPESEILDAYIDVDRITQVFSNLVDNAVKFTKSGYIEISAAKKEDLIECSVLDTGIGISAADLERIFSKFQQFGNAPRIIEDGAGLGLSIAKGIVELHGGNICAESAPGKGTRFIFTLPGCNSRGFLSEYVKDKLKEALKEGLSFSLIVISSAGFENLKHELSPERANSVIKEVEAIVKSSLRQSEDNLFKGRDEMVLILSKCNKEDAARIRERLAQALEYYISSQKLESALKLQFGYATYPDDATDEEGLIEKSNKIIESGVTAKKVLFVEDEPDQIMMVKLHLESQGYRVISAMDGEEGLTRARQDKPDLILLDLILPKIGGFEVCRRLKQEPGTSSIPILVITVSGVIDAKEKSFAAGADDYIQKPYDPKDLALKIEKLLKD